MRLVQAVLRVRELRGWGVYGNKPKVTRFRFRSKAIRAVDFMPLECLRLVSKVPKYPFFSSSTHVARFCLPWCVPTFGLSSVGGHGYFAGY